VNSATAADLHTGRVGGFGALFLCVVVHLLSVGGIFEEVATVRLLSFEARMQNYLEKTGTL